MRTLRGIKDLMWGYGIAQVLLALLGIAGMYATLIFICTVFA